MKIRQKKRRIISIPMSSLADVAFLLLIFLIVTSAINLNQSIDVTIPVSKHARSMENERQFEIIVDLQGKIYIQGQEVDLKQLKNKTLQEIVDFPQTIFFIKADEEIEYKSIDLVIQILKQNRIKNVVLVAKQEK